jgi:hypothetical protein
LLDEAVEIDAMPVGDEEVLGWMDKTLQRIARLAPLPQETMTPQGMQQRYLEQLPIQAIVLLLERCVSGLRASLVLLERQFVQESAALLRMVDENAGTVAFLALASSEPNEPPVLRRFLTGYFAEEDQVGKYRQKLTVKGRDMVSRKDILNYIAGYLPAGEDPFTFKNRAMAVHFTNSGYVHGAASHVLEMYDPVLKEFETSGSRALRQIYAHAVSREGSLDRAVVAFGYAAWATGDNALTQEVREYASSLKE